MNGEEATNPRTTIVPDLSIIDLTNDEEDDEEDSLEISGFSVNYGKYEAAVAIQPRGSPIQLLLPEEFDEDLFHPTEEQLRAKWRIWRDNCGGDPSQTDEESYEEWREYH
jgi:hypothetical protein